MLEKPDTADTGKGDDTGRSPQYLERHLRKAQVCALLPFSNAALYQAMNEEGFPKGFLLTPQVRVWPESEIVAWVETRKQSGSTQSEAA